MGMGVQELVYGNIQSLQSLSPHRKADGVVFVFDVTKPRSFTNVETIWMNAVDAPERYTEDYY